MPSAYIDVPTFQRMAFGVMTAPYIGGNTTLTDAATAGASTLTVGSISGFQVGQPVYLLDGPDTEYPTLLSASGTTLTLSGRLAYAHAAGVSASSPGTQGALAAAIISASGWLENFCQQGVASDRSLWSKARTETIRMPSTRAMIDPQYGLRVYPHNFPVASLASVAYTIGTGGQINLDPTVAIIDADAKSIILPITQPVGTQPNFPWYYGPPLRRDMQAWAILTYTAGFVAGAVPWDVQQATAWAVQEFLADAMNPTGAARVIQGDIQSMQRLNNSSRVTSGGDGIFLIQAKTLLAPYRLIAA